MEKSCQTIGKLLKSGTAQVSVVHWHSSNTKVKSQSLSGFSRLQRIAGQIGTWGWEHAGSPIKHCHLWKTCLNQIQRACLLWKAALAILLRFWHTVLSYCSCRGWWPLHKATAWNEEAPQGGDLVNQQHNEVSPLCLGRKSSVEKQRGTGGLRWWPEQSRKRKTTDSKAGSASTSSVA